MYSGSYLNIGDNKTQVFESFTYNGDGNSTLTAVAQYTQSTISTDTSVPSNTFAVTSRLGMFKRARYAEIIYDNVTNLRIVKVY